MITIQAKEPQLNIQDILGLEQSLLVKLPEDYKNFLLKYNVAEPESNIYKRGEFGVSVRYFFGKSQKDYFDLIENNKTYHGRLPEKVLAIGEDSGGNLFCLNLKDESIWFWDHEGEAMEGEEVNLDNMTKLAQTLPEFLEALELYQLTDLPPPDLKSIIYKKPGFDNKFKK